MLQTVTLQLCTLPCLQMGCYLLMPCGRSHSYSIPAVCDTVLLQGRIAMLGFTGILLTEVATAMPTWQFWMQRLGH